MRLITTITAAVALTASSAFAGGFDAEMVEAPVVMVENEPAGSSMGGSMGGALIPLLIGVAVIAAVASKGDDDNNGGSTGGGSTN